MGKLEGKVALVTGSGRNIGRATVLKLASEGAHVVVNSRTNLAEAEAVAQEARGRGVKAIAALADVARKDQVDAMVAKAMAEFGRVDILVNNAAIRPHKPFTEVTNDAGARFVLDRRYDARKLEPVVAKPHSPDNKALARELDGVKLTRAYIGSCTGG